METKGSMLLLDLLSYISLNELFWLIVTDIATCAMINKTKNCHLVLAFYNVTSGYTNTSLLGMDYMFSICHSKAHTQKRHRSLSSVSNKHLSIDRMKEVIT